MQNEDVSNSGNRRRSKMKKIKNAVKKTVKVLVGLACMRGIQKLVEVGTDLINDGIDEIDAGEQITTSTTTFDGQTNKNLQKFIEAISEWIQAVKAARAEVVTRHEGSTSRTTTDDNLSIKCQLKELEVAIKEVEEALHEPDED